MSPSSTKTFVCHGPQELIGPYQLIAGAATVEDDDAAPWHLVDTIGEITERQRPGTWQATAAILDRRSRSSGADAVTAIDERLRRIGSIVSTGTPPWIGACRRRGCEQAPS